LELIRGIQAAPACAGGCVVTIGTYDGVHLGHQALIGRLTAQAARLALPSVLLTFEPMPREYFSPADPLIRRRG
jgi:riboflavin kinase/FMN adenylyltransferase